MATTKYTTNIYKMYTFIDSFLIGDNKFYSPDFGLGVKFTLEE